MAKKVDVYQMVTDRIIESLEKGVMPWKKSWSTARPQNVYSKRPYSGINELLLGCFNWETPFFLTFKQCQALGGKIKKGEKSTFVVYWKILKIEDEETGNEKTIPLLRYYNVFNVSQYEGIDESKIPNLDQIEDFDHAEEIDQLLESDVVPSVEYGGDRACYIPTLDKIQMPIKTHFKDQEHYYNTLLHEIIHSTGHESRLDRLKNSRVREDYAFEELVAELGSAFLCTNFGIANTLDDNVSYIGNWLAALKNDKKFIISASSMAQKAVKYLLGESEEN